MVFAIWVFDMRPLILLPGESIIRNCSVTDMDNI